MSKTIKFGPDNKYTWDFPTIRFPSEEKFEEYTNWFTSEEDLPTGTVICVSGTLFYVHYVSVSYRKSWWRRRSKAVCYWYPVNTGNKMIKPQQFLEKL